MKIFSLNCARSKLFGSHGAEMEMNPPTLHTLVIRMIIIMIVVVMDAIVTVIVAVIVGRGCKTSHMTFCLCCSLNSKLVDGVDGVIGVVGVSWCCRQCCLLLLVVIWCCLMFFDVWCLMLFDVVFVICCVLFFLRTVFILKWFSHGCFLRGG